MKCLDFGWHGRPQLYDDPTYDHGSLKGFEQIPKLMLLSNFIQPIIDQKAPCVYVLMPFPALVQASTPGLL